MVYMEYITRMYTRYTRIRELSEFPTELNDHIRRSVFKLLKNEKKKMFYYECLVYSGFNEERIVTSLEFPVAK